MSHDSKYEKQFESLDMPPPPTSYQRKPTLGGYSFVAPESNPMPATVINGGPTKIVTPTLKTTQSVYRGVMNLISLVIERDVNAWRALPVSVRTVMVDNPNSFSLVFRSENESSEIPNIVFNDVEMLYNGTLWTLYSVNK